MFNGHFDILNNSVFNIIEKKVNYNEVQSRKLSHEILFLYNFPFISHTADRYD